MKRLSTGFLGAIVLASSSLALRADGGDPIIAAMKKAHDLLHQAMDEESAATGSQRIDLLKQAKDLLQHGLPPHYGLLRYHAAKEIDAAIVDLGKRAFDAQIKEEIRSADDDVRNMGG